MREVGLHCGGRMGINPTVTNSVVILIPQGCLPIRCRILSILGTIGRLETLALSVCITNE